MSSFTVISVPDVSSVLPSIVIVEDGLKRFTAEPMWEEKSWRDLSEDKNWKNLSDDRAVQDAYDESKDKRTTTPSFATLQDAMLYAFREKAQRSFRARLTNNSMPLAWIAFTQILYVAILFSPGVRFIGSAYAAVVQGAVALSAVMSHAPYLMTAARVSTAVAVGNLALALLVWQSAYSIEDQVAAAYRAAIVTAVGFCIVCSNQYLTRVSASHLRRKRADT